MNLHPKQLTVLATSLLLLLLGPAASHAGLPELQGAGESLAPAAASPLPNCPNLPPPDSTAYQAFEDPGIYVFLDGSHLDPAGRPWITGGHTLFPWNTIEDESQANRYWEEVDRYLAAEEMLGKKVGLSFNSYDGDCCGGDRMPAWYKQAHGPWPQGDGYVTCTWSDGGGTHTQDIPMYWGDAYQAAFEDFIAATADRYRDDPRVAFVEVSTGVYGENMPAENRPEVDQCLQDAGLTYQGWIETVNAIVDIYQRHWHDEPLLLQYSPTFLEGVERRETTDYAASQGVGLKYNKMQVDLDSRIIRSDIGDINPYVCRTGHYDPMLQHAGLVPVAWEGESIYFADESDVLWAYLEAMDKHPAYILASNDTMRGRDPLVRWTLEFAARYIGRTVANTPGVWTALRDTTATYYPQRGNFSFWLHQVDGVAGGHTRPVWQVTGDPWGRYARRTEIETGNPLMVFDVDDNFAIQPGQPVTISIRYLDRGLDDWELRYDALDDDFKSAGLVQKENSDQWREAVFALPDAEFANGQNGYDFRIDARGSGNEIVSFLEVRRGGGEEERGGEGERGRGGEGALPLTIDHYVPPNDDFDSATIIPAFPFEAAQDISQATSAGDDPGMGCSAGANANTVWFRFTAPASGFVNFNTVGSDYDTVLAAWQGPRGGLSHAPGDGCNNNVGWWTGTSSLNVAVATGDTVTVEVARLGDPAQAPAGGGQLALRAEFHTCTYSSDAAIVQGILDIYGIGHLFDSQISTVPTVSGGRCAITGFGLPYHTVDGPMPAGLGGLSNLQWLNFRNNKIVGTLPAELGNLGDLLILDLHQNALAGPVPASLGGLSRLQALNLADNRLSGGLPATLGNLGKLQLLHLSNNQFAGPLPAWLAHLPSLEQMWLGYNAFEGSLPGWLGQIERLRGLSLGHNSLSGSLPAGLGDLSQLRYLYLDGNQLTGALPAELGNLAELRSLFLAENQLTGPLPSALGALTNLEVLRLEHNLLSGPLPAGLGDLAALSDLHLDHNLFSGQLPAGLNQLTNLTGFYVNNTWLGGPLATDLGGLSALRRLALHSTRFSGPLPASLTSVDLWAVTSANSDLCEPDTAQFQAWWDSRPYAVGTGEACRLSLSKGVAPGSWAPGSDLTYQIAVQNFTGASIGSTLLVDTLPANVTFLGADPPPSSQGGNTLTWTLGSVPAGAAREIAVDVRLPLNSGPLTNSAQVTGQGSAGQLADGAVFVVDVGSVGATATPTATPTSSPTATATPSPTATPTATPTASLTSTPSPSATATPTASFTATATATASATPSPTASPTVTATATPGLLRVYLPLICR